MKITNDLKLPAGIVMKKKKTSGSKTKRTRIILGICTIVFYILCFILGSDNAGRVRINLYNEYLLVQDIIMFFVMGVWITGTAFSVKLAKELNRNTVGYGLGAFFSAMISSIVLLFLKVKPGTLSAQEREEKNRQEIENKILAAAKKNKGVLSVSEAALETKTSMDRVTEILDDLVKKDYAALEHTEHGTLKYFFPDFQKEEDQLE
jgi:hypothetical protein